MTRILIIDAGFAGLNAAKVFSGTKNTAVKIIDQKNYHLFQPLLYQVATAALNPADICYCWRWRHRGGAGRSFG